MTILQNLIYLGRQAKITSSLIVINIAWFVISRLFDSRSFVDSLKNLFLVDWGADVSQLTFSGQYWRMFTSLFMHVSLSHLLMNMIALWSVGIILEKRLPKFVFIGIYFLSGLISNLVSDIANLDRTVISCGASGAILGVITALLAYSLVNRANLKEMPINAIIISLLLTAGLGLLPGINNMAHLGGAVAGFGLGLVVSLLIKWFGYSSKFTVLFICLLFIVTIWCIYMGYVHYELPDNLKYHY